MSSRNDIIGLNKLYVDRVWVKAYPEFYSNPHSPDFKEKLREYMGSNSDIEDGVFKRMTDNFFKVYRTITALKIAFRKNKAVNDYEDLREMLRYGKNDMDSFAEFELMPLENKVKVGRFILTKEQILSSKWIMYPRVDRDRVVYEKVFFMRIEPWFSVSVKPFVSGFSPPMIRCFLNGIVFVKTQLGIKFDTSNYEYHTENWIDLYSEGFNFEKFMEGQGIFFKVLREIMPRTIKHLWIGFFDRDEDLAIKVTQVELSHDTYIEKLRLVNALRLLPGKSKTMKYDLSGEQYASEGSDIGMKYYVTIRKGLQVKTYSKAYHKVTGRILNRFEITQNLNKSIYELEEKDLYNNTVRELVIRVNAGLSDNKTIEEIRKMISPFIRAKKPEYRCLHETFLLDLFIHGQIKGKGVYRELARIYSKHGIIEVSGRGRNSVYVLKPEFMFIHENIREVFGDIPEKLFATKEHPQRAIAQENPNPT
jgi:hypothetical protein